MIFRTTMYTAIMSAAACHVWLRRLLLTTILRTSCALACFRPRPAPPTPLPTSFPRFPVRRPVTHRREVLPPQSNVQCLSVHLGASHWRFTWLPCRPILMFTWPLGVLKNHDSLLNGFWKFHSKSLVHFLGPGHSICRAQVNTTLGFPSDSRNWCFKRFSTTMLRAIGQQKWSKRTTSNSIDWFWKPNLSHFCFKVLKSLHKKHVFSNFLGLTWRGDAVGSIKKLCTRVLLQNAVHDKNHRETRTSRIESVLCGWKKLWT